MCACLAVGIGITGMQQFVSFIVLILLLDELVYNEVVD